MIARLASVLLIISGACLVWLSKTVEVQPLSRSLGEAQITDLTGNMEPVTFRLTPEDDRFIVHLRSLITYPVQKEFPEAQARVVVRAGTELVEDAVLSLRPSSRLNIANPLLEFMARASSEPIVINFRDRYELTVERVAGGDFPILNLTVEIGTWPRRIAQRFYLQWGIGLMLAGAGLYLITGSRKRGVAAQMKKRPWGRGE